MTSRRARARLHGSVLLLLSMHLWTFPSVVCAVVLVNDIRQVQALPGLDVPGISANALFPAGLLLFFRAFTVPYGYELWKSDGTVAGTTVVKDIRPGAQDGLVQSPRSR